MTLHLKFPLAESQRAHGYSSDAKHTGQCDEEEVGAERDNSINWLQLEFCKFSNALSHKNATLKPL